MARLPLKKKTQIPPVNLSVKPTMIQKAKIVPIKAKGGLNGLKYKLATIKPKVMSRLALKKNKTWNNKSTLAVPGVPVEHSSIFYANTVPATGFVAKPTMFQKAKLAVKNAKASVISKPVVSKKTVYKY
jgi:hypothetical protein